MNIGIIVFSQTGNTLSVSKKLQDRLIEKSHQVQIESITIDGKAEPGNFQITGRPETAGYDALVFAAPVQAFSLNPVMKSYLEELSSLKDKPVAFLTTKQLPFNWTGGNRAVRTMEKICRSKGAKPIGSGIVVWKDTRREATTEQAIQVLSELFPIA